MKKIEKFISDGIYTEKSFAELDSSLSFGILAKTKSTTIYKTDKPIYVTLLVESSKHKKCKMQIPTKTRTMETLIPNNVEMKVAFHCPSRCETYYEDKGLVENDVIVDAGKYLIHEYSEKKNGED